MYSFLIGAWAECRLQKLLHEEFGFSDIERTEVNSQDTQLAQWKMSVDLAFRKHHSIRNAPLDKRVLGVATAARREALLEVLEKDLRIIIEIRNRLAHGQWIYPLDSTGKRVEQDKYQALNRENLQSLQFKLALVSHIADAVHDLVVSPETFERDFEAHFRKLYQVKKNMQSKNYAKYEAALVTARHKARIARRDLSNP